MRPGQLEERPSMTPRWRPGQTKQEMGTRMTFQMAFEMTKESTQVNIARVGACLSNGRHIVARMLEDCEAPLEPPGQLEVMTAMTSRLCAEAAQSLFRSGGYHFCSQYRTSFGESEILQVINGLSWTSQNDGQVNIKEWKVCLSGSAHDSWMVFI